ncbi:protein kinase [Actinomadura barringtoniae]|uniref:Protein kinase n=1 Tax=Actinomadura barringtoniae TaxID=1427535 RepID=A0A939PRV2_9ACTN|nr:serine/threonine-protein kinase [Actinomadura barringtoniae]MBO2455103.1 protein kinase [Actinomadura barringtoniae]
MGPYQVVRRLGAGGMGIVYLAAAPDDELVAVKVMNPEWASQPGFRERFQREVQAIGRVAPFCTAPVLDAAITDDAAYIVTEYVEGRTLWQTVKERGPLGGARLESVAVGTAVALTAVHRAGIIHRDLKPGNVILSPEGTRVIDFGVAKLAEAAPITGNVAIGTPPFMSPEQARGLEVTPASDVFSWGSVVAFAATGRAPFGTTAAPEVFYRLVHEQPDLEGLPERLAPLVERSMDKDPGKRPSARDLIDELLGRPVGVAAATDISRERWSSIHELGTRVETPPPDSAVPKTEAASPASLASPASPVSGPTSRPDADLEAEADTDGRSSERKTEPPPGRQGLRRVFIAVLATAVVGVSAGVAYVLVQPGHGVGHATFQDDFQTKRGWPERQDAGGAARYYGGAYLLQLPPGRGMVAAAPVRSDEMGSVRVSAGVRIQAGTAEYGVWCGGNPVRQATNRYDFYLTSTGAAGIAKQSATGGRKELRAAQEVSGVDTTGGQNVIQADCRFSSGLTRLQLSVNGRVAATADDRDQPYGPGSCGVEALSDTGGVESAAVRYESFGAAAIS